MDLTKYRNKLIGSEDERAVSPVIGVILMVAITVILAAVIAAFVLDIGDLDETSPNATFDWEQDVEADADGDISDGNVTVTHSSGDSLDPDTITVFVDGEDEGIEDWSDGDITASDDLVIDVDGNEVGDEIEIVWESSDGSQSQTLDSFTIN